MWLSVARVVAVAVVTAVFIYYNRQQQYNYQEPPPRRPPNGGSRRTNSPQRRRNCRVPVELHSGLRKIITDTLNNGTYDCVICLEEITKESSIGSCKTCYQICHLACLRDLIIHCREEGKTPSCPTCRDVIPGTLVYKCFCGKECKPPPIPGLTPHTCGAVCGKNGCQLPCHPGPCETRP